MPPLPIETWRQILRHVVHVPEQLDTEWIYPIEAASWRNWTWRKEDLRRSMTMKRHLVLVSKAWREIAVELLYEDIQLQNSQHVALLINIFEASKQPGMDKGYGWWTRRVVLPVPNDAKALAHLQFLDLCFNIETLITIPEFREDHYALEPVCNSIQNRFSHSLRRFDIKFRPHRVFRFDINLERLSTLRSLQLPVSTLGTLKNEQGKVFPLVTTLALHLVTSLDVWPGWKFPALRHLSLLNLGEADVDALEPFVSQHGASITSLHLHIPGICRRIDFLLSFVPALRSLVLGFDDLTFVNEPVKNVTHLGLEEDNTADQREPVILSQALERRLFPNLEVVRILDRDANGMVGAQEPEEDEEVDNLGGLVSICLQYGLRPEDGDGRLIQLESI